MNKTVTQYWTSNRIRAVVIGPGSPSTVALDKPFALIGCHEKADLKLDGVKVARRHLFALATDAGIHILDLVDGRQQKKQQGFWLNPEQVITVGDHQLRLGFVDRELPQQPPATSLLAHSARRPFPLIQCKSDGAIIGRPYLNRSLAVIGRRESCKFQFTTRSVSPEHCAFYQQDGRLWIVDFHSTRKTKKDNVSIECAQLKDGSCLQIGRVEIEVCMGRSQTDSRHLDSSTDLEISASPAMADADSSASGSLLLAESGPFPEITDQERDRPREPLEGLSKNQIPIGTLTPSENLSPGSEDGGSGKNERLVQELNQSETNLSNAQADLHATQSELEQARREMEDLHSAQQDNQVLIQQLQSELDSALKQIGQQDLDKQTREANWRETEDQLIQQNELSKSQLEQNQQKLTLSITEIASLQEKIVALKAECQSQQNLLAEMKETKTALEINSGRLATTEKQLEEQFRSVDQRDQQIEEQRKQIETHTQELEQLAHDHQTDSQSREQELHVIHMEISQKREGLDQAEKEIEAGEAELSAATQALQKDREQITLDQQAVEQQTEDQLEEKEQLSQLRQRQQTAEVKQQTVQEQLEQRQANIDEQTAELAAQREAFQQETGQTEKRLRQSALQLEQREAKLHQQQADHAQSSQPASSSNLEREQLSSLQEQLNKERAELKTAQIEWQSLVLAKEREFVNRDTVVLAAEQSAKENQVKIDADRKELEHYSSIDHAQRQILANLNGIQKEKSITNRFWSWFGFPFRKP